MKDKSLKKVLVLGSGPIKIGQAAEFDYAGTQACRVLRNEGIYVVLLNSNPATIQTDNTVADKVYIKPLTKEYIEEILKKENPDGVLATLGGQTALNLCMECEELGIWEKYGCRVLGTSAKSIWRAEGREPFRHAMLHAMQPIVESRGISTVREAKEFAAHNPFPLILRPDFTLGGTGNSVVYREEDLVQQTEDALEASPIHKALVERYLLGWHEIETEVVRDKKGNKVLVCSMENIDPMGIHTGDSVVVSPIQTVSKKAWKTLKQAAFDIVDELEICGACNVQFALNDKPDGTFEYYVIEVNPRASRSSALASKATGYPIARIATHIAIGQNLDEIPDPVTGEGNATKEPQLDYVAVKVPTFPFESFPGINKKLSSQMKATGEVLSLAENYTQAIVKAYRSISYKHIIPFPKLRMKTEAELWDDVLLPTHLRMEAMAELLRRGITGTRELAKKTYIGQHFINCLKKIVDAANTLEQEGLTDEALKRAVDLGFNEEQITVLTNVDEGNVRKRKEEIGKYIRYKKVAEHKGDEGSGYYYGVPRDISEGRQKTPDVESSIVVLGSGPIKIAQGVEFDYCCVKAAEAVRRRGLRAVMINVNPETVSTDSDTSNALYVEPLTAGDALPILDREKARGVFACFGGQTSLNLGLDLAKCGVQLFGSSAEAIDTTEDRGKFSRLLAKIGVNEPKGWDVASIEEALEVVEKYGYPIMVRPSFVIGGVAMTVAHNESELRAVLGEAFDVMPGARVMLDQFIIGREYEVDAICDGEDVLIPGIFEHIDPSGVHSGDSMAIFPSYSLSKKDQELVLEFVRQISKNLSLKGLLNVQFVRYEDQFYIIEANPRASRTVPIASKISGLPIIDIAVGVSLGEKLSDMPYGTGLYTGVTQIGVKVPVFSNDKLPGMPKTLGPRMMSTGESLGIADNLSAAVHEALIGAGWKAPSGY